VGQLTAQAGRIAGDIAAVAGRFRTAFDSQAASDLRRSIRDFADMADRLAKVTAEQAEVIRAIGGNIQRSSENASQASSAFAATALRFDSATAQGQVGTLMENASAASGDLRAASTDLRSLLAAAQANQQSIVNILVGADSMMSRVVNRTGSLGLLVGDSTLYQEATLTLIQLRQLLADIQANPRRYFTFSVF
jgi:phospholipid/cholesterol/gamma-HCH transport system substrate-binding protein